MLYRRGLEKKLILEFSVKTNFTIKAKKMQLIQKKISHKIDLKPVRLMISFRQRGSLK